MSENFAFYSKYYNLLYKDKNYSAETEYISTLIRKHRPDAKSILEFGSGTGIHGSMLKEAGFNVYGLEQSEGMVSEARKRGYDCQQADISNFKLDRSFDCVISLFHVISYLNDNESLISTFKNAHTHLNTNGLFIFDVWYSPAVYDQKAVPRIKRMENNELRVIRFAEPIPDVNKNVVTVKYTLHSKDLETGTEQELEELHPMRHFSIPEIELLAKLTGFDCILAEEFVTQKTPSTESWGVCFVLRKK